MGALTLKSFPFVLRNWDINTYSFIDPTDAFAVEINVYVEKNQVIKVEPCFSNNTSHNWITDKGRHFFDSIFTFYNSNSNKVIRSEKAIYRFDFLRFHELNKIFFNIFKYIYIFDLCNFKHYIKKKLLIIFENISIESLNTLLILVQIYSFIKLKRVENIKLNTDLETNFQINFSNNCNKLLFSSLCILLNINTRYEGAYLNLNLRLRYFKGNFKLILIGSLINLTVPFSLINSNMLNFKNIIEGNSSVCQDIITSINPILIANSESLKRIDMQQFHIISNIFSYSNLLNKTWNGLNTLNSSLCETGLYNSSILSFLTLKDFLHFSFLYFININILNIANLKKIIESKLLKNNFLNHKATLLSHNDNGLELTNIKKKSYLKNLISKNTFYLPGSNFFENNETFLNTEGLVRKKLAIISNKDTKTNWQFLRAITNKYKSNKKQIIQFITNIKNNKSILYNTLNKNYNFNNYINFNYYALQVLTTLNPYLIVKNIPFVIIYNKFKINLFKIYQTKIKYWMDDFFTGGKDIYCSYSFILANCSLNIRVETDNFFTA